MPPWPLRPRQPFTGLALSAAAGIVGADHWLLPVAPLLIVSGLAALALIVRPRTYTCWLFAGVAFFTLHTLRQHQSTAAALADELGPDGRALRATGIVWSEPEAPRFASRTVTARFLLKMEACQLDDGVRRVRDVLTNVSWSGAMPAYGDRVELAGFAQNLRPARNPGEFDITDYLHRQGIRSEIRTRYAADCLILAHGQGSRAQSFAFAARRWVQRQLERDLENEPAITGLIESMVLGLKTETLPDVKEIFQRTGTLHLFAVSGLNVAMLGALVWIFLKPLRVRRAAAVCVTIPLLCGYALVTGLSASCVRATVMGTLVLLAYLFDRRPVLYNSLSAAACVILAWDTNQLFSPGFQFSFALVFTIAFLAQRIQQCIEPFGLPDPFLPRPLWSWTRKVGAHGWSGFASTFGVTLAAWSGSLLFTAGYFHLFSGAAILANLVAVPLAFAVLGLGLLAVVASPISLWAAVLSNNANWLCAKLLLWWVATCALIPGGNFYVEPPRLARAPDCEIVVFDLESGGAAHVRSRGRDWLLDCGSSFRYKLTILPYLRTRGVNQLDALLVTHGDTQHMGGALGALDDFHPRQIIDSTLLDRSPTRRALHLELARRNVGKTFARRGDSFALSPDATLSVLYPPAGRQRSAADDKALVVRLESSGVRVLFMSDSGFSTEQWLLNNEPDMRADLLIKGQHAKDLSGTPDFIARVQPQVIISAGATFGGASLDQWAQDVVARGITLFRQDRTGAAQIIIRDGAFAVVGFLDRQTFRSRAR